MKMRLILVIGAFCAGLLAHPALTAQTSGRRVIQPKRFPYLGLPFSPAIAVGDTMYLAGVLGRDPGTTKLVSGGIEAETRQALNNIREILREGGMDFRDVVSTTAYIVDFKDFDGYNKVTASSFQRSRPRVQRSAWRLSTRVAGLSCR